jgi:hypothetical protein
VSKSPFDLVEQQFPDFEDAVFEFTPAGYGSKLYGYWPGSHPEVDVATSVSASAAFFDSQQRTMGRAGRLVFGSALRFFQLEWGVDIANPARLDRDRGWHAALPFPVYLFQGTKNPQSPHIHLSDGGQSDNTGVFSLVRRGSRVIVYADAAEDEEGRFDDLCVLRQQLKPKQLHLFIPTLTRGQRDFAVECDADAGTGIRGKTRPYPLWSFASGVLEGCITRNATDTSCSSAQDNGYRARLFILKPSLNIDAVKPHIEACRNSGGDKEAQGNYLARLDTDACRVALANAQAAQPGLSVELFGYLVRNWEQRRGDHLTFPQHQTWKITLDSSAWMFGAYKALGAWHTQQLLDVQKALRNAASSESLAIIEKTPPSKRTYLDPIALTPQAAPSAD